jgi:hypothetical protein
MGNHLDAGGAVVSFGGAVVCAGSGFACGERAVVVSLDRQPERGHCCLSLRSALPRGVGTCPGTIET